MSIEPLQLRLQARPASRKRTMKRSNTLVCFSISSGVVAGHINNMVWNGVTRMPSFM